MSTFIAFVSVIGFVGLILACVEFDRVRKLVAKILFGSLAVALFTYGAFALQNVACAEEEQFYQIVAIITSIEDSDFDDVDVLVEVDDLDNLWTYYEVIEDVEFNSDKEFEDSALRFLIDNSIEAETLREHPLAEGRIVVIQLWTCGTDTVEDDEIINVYYTQFIAT